MGLSNGKVFLVLSDEGFSFDKRYSLHAKVVSTIAYLFLLLFPSCVYWLRDIRYIVLIFLVFLRREMCFGMVARYPTFGIIKRFIVEFIEIH